MTDKYWKKPDQTLLGVVLLLLLIGLAAVSSASSVLSFQRFGHNNYYFFRQIGFVTVGLLALFIFSRIDYHFWKKKARLLLIGSVLVLGLVLVPGLGFKSGGTTAWFSIGAFLLQPSEFVKLSLVFYLAYWFDRKVGAESNFWFGILPPLSVAAGLVGLLLLQPDLGTAIVYAIITFVILFVAGTKYKYLFGLAAAAGVALWFVVQTAPYRIARITAFLNPKLDPQGIGYHITQALIAIGSGGLWGYGFGASRQKHNYLPESIGDSIFAVMAEELGFVRILVIVLLFTAFAILGLRIAKLAPDRFGQLAAVGITGWIVFQAMVNMGAISNLLPLTGITLPFISYGGSSLLALSVATGVLLNISRQRA
ncbi:MAG: cell division protein FtsW [Candidatus Doudnabacteria bacterium RIFCSPHIGHO2_02_FULL_48_21]|uniref:Probable peptidoglycan glycosyltransferase FtsW n=1 Tax=Candidatus Doudnabacteria bacterium RIFCSPLOWO2_02_FULL_48_13 TaxID=1817845 RepID=A0A1F5Q9Z4_9BACT|nr:MAG: cell division protein FtsW [Candidatus Doudnabacteria bacterium RIFCSPHIGHO2_01_48_18]OGE79608.1 MAG: cell division protein FtsW [Candidatus Doudnabacteria bacterium RIFCSPHIGHO2_01_FULL_48_180]OGE91149.1 MAG: cell division protein FtsW [Candidatus Doudnabacteria bacterium RIFCSPHIGHO2_12_FULL_47_25]OGE93826.1 MAG: cell division protein FtsW [Candidatus Doudnabacteria bacterium RIFCSPHIGHO2_02_FULL_48_21]OGE98011.1 MAG: cell division protein FtsW [Candidatus Doudnabacteria bacterium RIF